SPRPMASSMRRTGSATTCPRSSAAMRVSTPMPMRAGSTAASSTAARSSRSVHPPPTAARSPTVCRPAPPWRSTISIATPRSRTTPRPPHCSACDTISEGFEAMFDDFYGLTGRPFQLTPDPNFYFESTTHRKALSYLGYGMAQGEGFIVITGEVGAGKSTLVAHLMQKIDRNHMTVGQVVTSNLDGEELVHVVAQSFGLDVQGHDKASALGAIESFLHEEARA